MKRVFLKMMGRLCKQPAYALCALVVVGLGWVLKDGGVVRLSLDVAPTKTVALSQSQPLIGSENEGSDR